MRTIPLTRGKVAIVDDGDYELVAAFSWYAERNGNTWYAKGKVRVGDRQRSQSLHRLILAASPGAYVDHIDGDGLNNRRANIRLCTASQNAANSRRGAKKHGVHRGVFWDKRGFWKARVRVLGRAISLGVYTNPEDAARAYDAAALLHFGEFARLNFPSEVSHARAS